MSNPNNPLVSIIIPCYNHEQFVQECIQSVIDQDYQNIELIIIDDGSKDNSVQKIEEMRSQCEERFIRFEFRHRHNKGLCATLNEALEWCEGEYYSAIASDDIMLPYKTMLQVNEFQNCKDPSIIGVFTGMSIFGEQRSKKKVGKNTIYTFKDIFLHNCVLTTPTLMLRRKEIIKIGGYNEDSTIEDYELFLRLTHKGYFIKAVDTVTVLYRRHDSNLSSQHQIMINSVLQILELYKNNPLYKKAISKAYMVSAHSTQKDNKQQSWQYMMKGFIEYPLNIFSKSFAKYIIKSILK